MERDRNAGNQINDVFCVSFSVRLPAHFDGGEVSLRPTDRVVITRR